METKKIAPKTLVAVLAAQIKEDAETIALKIVEASKGSDIDYSMLVENYVLKKDNYSPLLFSQFAENIFNEVKGIEKFKKLEVVMRYKYGFERDDVGPKLIDDTVNIDMEIDEKRPDENYFYISAYGNNKNAFSAYNQFKANISTKIINRNAPKTEVIIDSEIPEPETNNKD